MDYHQTLKVQSVSEVLQPAEKPYSLYSLYYNAKNETCVVGVTNCLFNSNSIVDDCKVDHLRETYKE